MLLFGNWRVDASKFRGAYPFEKEAATLPPAFGGRIACWTDASNEASIGGSGLEESISTAFQVAEIGV